MKEGPNNIILKYFYNRVHKQNKNLIAIITGGTGSGKSYMGLLMALLIDPSFTLTNLVFSARDFLSLINSGDLKRGSVILWDETGVGIDKKEFWSITNKVINHILQTFRSRNYIVIMTVPSLDFIDPDSRKLIHFYGETKRIEEDKNLSVLKPFFVSYNSRSSKIYYKYPIMNTKYGDLSIRELKFPLPPKRIRNKYEKMKETFLTDLLEKAELEILASEHAKDNIRQKVKFSDLDLVTRIGKKKKAFINEKGRIDPFKIMGAYNVGETRAKKIRAMVESKLNI